MEKEKLNVWSTQIKRTIEAQNDKIFRKDYGFYKIDRLEKIAERIDSFSETCEHCKQLKPEVESIAASVAESVNGTPRQRSEYERRNEAIVDHLRKVHGLEQAIYNLSLYTLLGMAIGLSISIILSFTLVPELTWDNIWLILLDTHGSYPASDTVRLVFLLGFIPLAVAGRIVGARKDAIIRKSGRLL